MRIIPPSDVRARLAAGTELALIDVREEARFATGHPLFAAQLPVRLIAAEAPARLPRRDVPLVLYGDDGDDPDVIAGAAAFGALGYSDVMVMDGGVAGWRAAGFELFEDVNSYAKAFAEWLAARVPTPELSAEALAQMRDEGAPYLLFDVRTVEEYRRMTVPDAISLPGGEIADLALGLEPGGGDVPIIVHCAGRARGILAARALGDAGVANPVFVLRNGTIGWVLAGQKLEKGADTIALSNSRRGLDTGAVAARARAAAIAAGVGFIDDARCAMLRADRTRTLYCYDVRLANAYGEGHDPGFHHAPGGQLVLQPDHYAPVRHSRIVLDDDGAGRASLVAAMLCRMGFESYVRTGGAARWTATGADVSLPPRTADGAFVRTPRPGSDRFGAMQDYIDWQSGLIGQLDRDGTHNFRC